MTERHRRTAKTERERLRVWQAAVDSACTGVSLADAHAPDRGLCFVNPAFEQMTGYSLEEVLGRNCRFLQGDDRDQISLVKVREALQSGTNCQVLLRNYKRNGDLFWNELRISPVLGESGEITHFIGIQHDVTDREEAAAGLRRKRDLYEQLLDAVDGAVWEWTPESDTYVQVSRYVERLFGYPADRWTRDKGFWKTAIHQDDRDVVVALRKETLAKGGTAEAEYRIERADGEMRLVREVMTLAPARPNHPRTLRGLVRDVSSEALPHDHTEDLALRSEVERLTTENAELRRTRNMSAELVALLDADGRIRYAGSGWSRGLDISPSAISGRALEELTHPEDLAALKRALDDCRQDSPLVELDARLRDATGSYSSWRATLESRLKDDRVQGVVATLRRTEQGAFP